MSRKLFFITIVLAQVLFLKNFVYARFVDMTIESPTSSIAVAKQILRKD